MKTEQLTLDVPWTYEQDGLVMKFQPIAGCEIIIRKSVGVLITPLFTKHFYLAYGSRQKKRTFMIEKLKEFLERRGL